MTRRLSPKGERSAASIAPTVDRYVTAGRYGPEDMREAITDLLADVLMFGEKHGFDGDELVSIAATYVWEERGYDYDGGLTGDEPPIPEWPGLAGLRFHPMVGGGFVEPVDGTTSVDEALAVAIQDFRSGHYGGEPVAVLITDDDGEEA